jgi:hypothetical protein
MRNQLDGDYDTTAKGGIMGDLRRLEKDTLDEMHVEMYSRALGISKKKVRKLFQVFFDGEIISEFQHMTGSEWAAFYRRYWPNGC